MAAICLLTCCPEKTREFQVGERPRKHKTVGSTSVPILALEERKYLLHVLRPRAISQYLVEYFLQDRALQT